MGKCLTCGKNSEGSYCFVHKPRKAMPRNRKWTCTSGKCGIQRRDMKDFFKELWDQRKHVSEVSGTRLGSEPLTIFFHHILPKEKYPQAAYDPENIIFLTWEEHDQVEMDIYRYEEVNKRRETLKTKYERS